LIQKNAGYCYTSMSGRSLVYNCLVSVGIVRRVSGCVIISMICMCLNFGSSPTGIHYTVLQNQTFFLAVNKYGFLKLILGCWFRIRHQFLSWTSEFYRVAGSGVAGSKPPRAPWRVEKHRLKKKDFENWSSRLKVMCK